MGAQETPDTVPQYPKRFTTEQLQDVTCGFCGKTKAEVKNLIVGLRPDVAICDECTTWCWEIVSGTEVPEEFLRAQRRDD